MVVTADEEDAEDEEEKEEKDEKEEEGEELRRWLDHTGSMPYNNASPEEGILNDGGLSAKLKCPASISRLRVEKIEGGLMVAGVVVAANCQIALPAFGFLFVLVGAVLTAASYRGPGEDEDKDSYAARIAFTGNSRILGPICIVVGALMFGLGALLCALTRRARRRERRVGFHCPLHGDFYPLSPAQGAKMIGKNVGGWTKIPCFRGRASLGSDSKLGARSGPPQCPHSVLSSTRSSVSSSPLSPCPTPMPFLVTSGSMSSGMVQISAGTNLSPDQTFGSIRSLSVTREVASFPLSRTPTPPPQHRSLSNSISTKHEETSPDSQSRGTPKSEVRDVIAAQRQDSPSPAERAAQPSRKSVSIVLPDESLG
ncbi:PREDICTED: uncharacterized protein LOC105361999 [Ceratosolen solmsi marchali]|uniref:Uncharacterized protein LOC105361999 n=1 Tax=Ceratosolen solmsi marchali TaxID=326594 RepID=A0AAJ7DV74_9HYME|nr:PREDICTED: uncharacterized protein LOC105361999 [Ceratosolen solmsi marchali]